MQLSSPQIIICPVIFFPNFLKLFSLLSKWWYDENQVIWIVEATWQSLSVCFLLLWHRSVNGTGDGNEPLCFNYTYLHVTVHACVFSYFPSMTEFSVKTQSFIGHWFPLWTSLSLLWSSSSCVLVLLSSSLLWNKLLISNPVCDYHILKENREALSPFFSSVPISSIVLSINHRCSQQKEPLTA